MHKSDLVEESDVRTLGTNAFRATLAYRIKFEQLTLLLVGDIAAMEYCEGENGLQSRRTSTGPTAGSTGGTTPC